MPIKEAVKSGDLQPADAFDQLAGKPNVSKKIIRWLEEQGPFRYALAHAMNTPEKDRASRVSKVAKKFPTQYAAWCRLTRIPTPGETRAAIQKGIEASREETRREGRKHKKLTEEERMDKWLDQAAAED